jgi:hypothetical protein
VEEQDLGVMVVAMATWSSNFCCIDSYCILNQIVQK